MTVGDARLRVLLIGHGRMGRLVEQLAGECGVDIVGHLTRNQASEASVPGADVAIDFSTADAVVVNAPRLAAQGMSLVIGTTGWQASEAQVRASVEEFPIGVIAAPNFAIGVNAFAAICERAAELLVRGHGFAPWIHEAHHAAKKDAPSGTAIALQRVIEAGRWKTSRRRFDARGVHSGHAHGRIRRRGGGDYAHAHGTRPHAVRSWRPRSGAVDQGTSRVVYDAGHAGFVTSGLREGFQCEICGQDAGRRWSRRLTRTARSTKRRCED